MLGSYTSEFAINQWLFVSTIKKKGYATLHIKFSFLPPRLPWEGNKVIDIYWSVSKYFTTKNPLSLDNAYLRYIGLKYFFQTYSTNTSSIYFNLQLYPFQILNHSAKPLATDHESVYHRTAGNIWGIISRLCPTGWFSSLKSLKDTAQQGLI